MLIDMFVGVKSSSAKAASKAKVDRPTTTNANRRAMLRATSGVMAMPGSAQTLVSLNTHLQRAKEGPSVRSVAVVVSRYRPRRKTRRSG